MVDCYGKWTAEQDYNNYPKELWCDYDYIAAWVIKAGYEPKTSVNNLTKMILAHYDLYLMDNNEKFYTDIEESENDVMISIVDVACFVYENGGLREFDYYC